MISKMSSSILDVITHYQKSIEKSAHDEARLLHCIEKLYKLPVTVEHLQTTGVGKTVNSLRKYDNEVGVAAKALVAKWKTMVAAEEKDAGSDSENRKSSYNEDDGESGNNRNRNSTINSNNTITPSNHLSSNHKSHKINSTREGQDYVIKNKSGHDRLNSNDHGNSNSNNSSSSRKHHKSSKQDYNLHISKSSNNDLDNNIPEKKYKTGSNFSGIKTPSFNNDYDLEMEMEIKQELMNNDDDDDDDDDDDLSSTEYDGGEKLIIDVKVKSEASDDDDEEHSETKDNKDHRNVTSKGLVDKRNYDNKDKNNCKKETLTTKIKESNKKENSSKDKKNSHSHYHHHKSKHHDEKKLRHDKSETKSSSSHHRHKSSDESRYRDKQKDKEKDKSNNNRNSSEKNSHHASGSNSDSRKHKRKMSIDSDSKLISAPPKTKVAKVLEEGIDSSMGTSFEEALGMLSAPSSSSGVKNSSKNKPKASTPSTSSSNNIAEDNFIKPSSSKTKVNTPELLTSTAKLTPLDLNIAFELPTISPNYKPMPLNPTVMECVFNNKHQQSQRKTLTDEEALAAGISSKTVRTKVYSGAKSGQLHQVPNLFDLCIWVLQKNIDSLEYTGGVPFDVLKSVLELATPIQLAIVEEYNPYLMEDTDILWEKICARHCKGVKRQEMETWREMYMRCQEEREERLSKLTENIKQSQKQITQPIRKTQLAYVDSMVKPPRNVQRKQEQFGTSHRKVTTPAARIASLSTLAPNIAKAPDNKVRINSNERDTAQATAPSRPRKAPLMQKTLQLMKGRFKR